MLISYVYFFALHFISSFDLSKLPEAKIFAHLYAGVEGFDAEVNGAVNVSQVGQLDPEKEQVEDWLLVKKRNNSV